MLEFGVLGSISFWSIGLVAASLLFAAHALLNKKNSRSALGWTVFILVAPMVGVIAYLLFGVNRLRRRALAIRGKSETDTTSVQLDIASIRILQQPMIPGNSVESLLDASSIFAEITKAVKSAHSEIYLSVYIFEAHGVGQRLIGELGQACERGVKVKVLLDGIGTLYSFRNTRKALEKRGVDVGIFLPPKIVPPFWHINLRNHRKILLIDNYLAFVGGTNIRNAYTQEKQPEEQIRDMMFLLRGPIVEDVQRVFVEDWLLTTRESLPGWRSGPEHEPLSTAMASCRVITDGPDNSVDIIALAYQAAMAKAKHRVRIISPYFLPPDEVIAAIQLAAVRGVHVEIILTQRNNIKLVHWATKNMLWQLLQYGVKVFYQQGPFDHSKLLLIDNDYALIGSANVDARSLRLNFEIVVEVESDKLSDELNEHVSEKIASAELLSAEQLNKQTLFERFRNAISWLLSPYL